MYNNMLCCIQFDFLVGAYMHYIMDDSSRCTCMISWSLGINFRAMKWYNLINGIWHWSPIYPSEGIGYTIRHIMRLVPYFYKRQKCNGTGFINNDNESFILHNFFHLIPIIYISVMQRKFINTLASADKTANSSSAFLLTLNQEDKLLRRFIPC